MSYTLAIEGSTYAGSVALIRGNAVIAERTLADRGIPTREGREENVLPSVAECLTEAGARVDEIEHIVCGAGPGSFTSLRISASVAKGIAVGIGCPIFSVSSLLLSVAAASSALVPGLYLSVLPAMRDEWFALPVDVADGGAMKPAGDLAIIPESQLRDAAALKGARLAGPGQDIDTRPHARGVVRLLDEIVAGGPVAIDTWEPDYGRLAEAQVRWEAAHGRPLGVSA